MRYILGVVGVIALFILVIILLMSPGSDSSTAKTTDRGTIVLTDYADKDSAVRLTTYGPVVADENRQAVRLTVSPLTRTQEILQGYQSQLLKTQSFQNNHAAYETYLHALNTLAFTKQRVARNQDRIGACPFGRVVIYQLFNQNKEVFSSWSTSCSTKDGTFAGVSSSVAQLFQVQFPNYSAFTSGLKF